MHALKLGWTEEGRTTFTVSAAGNFGRQCVLDSVFTSSQALRNHPCELYFIFAIFLLHPFFIIPPRLFSMAYNLSSNELAQCIDSLHLQDTDPASKDTTGKQAARLSLSSPENDDLEGGVNTPEDGRAEPLNNAQTCVVCGKPARLFCQGCDYDEEQGIRTSTWYCGKVCQGQHWGSHRSLCLKRQRLNQLYRAAQIVQSAFYCFREKMFDCKIIAVEVTEDEIRLHPGTYHETESVCQPFPEQLISDPAVREAALSYWSCNESLSWMHGLWRTLLEGMR